MKNQAWHHLVEWLVRNRSNHNRVSDAGRNTAAPTGSPPAANARVAIAIAAGVVAGLLLWLRFRAEGPYDWALDFTPYWRAGDAFRRGVSPYVAINATDHNYPCCSAGFLYMLPAAVLAIPFSHLPAQPAAVLATSLYVGVFAYALMRDGYWRLPLLLSYPLVFCALSAQIVPLTTAAFLLPALGVFASVKFTHGAVGWLYNLSRVYFIGAGAVVVASIVIWPWWPGQFWAERHDVMDVIYHVPILLPGGFLALLALIRWRRPEARMVAAMACMPQAMLFYDQLPLTLVAQTYRESLLAAVWSWSVPALGILLYGNAPIDRHLLFERTAPYIVWFYYLPAAAVVVFRRPKPVSPEGT